jgi:uncharacterized repeat protein (TIGR01451 family)
MHAPPRSVIEILEARIAPALAPIVDISFIQDPEGFRVSRLVAGDAVGSSISAAGDLNGDGFGDFVVGAPEADANGRSSGSVFVVFGRPSGFPTDLAANEIIEIRGATTAHQLGVTASGAGDVNGDGYGDLIIGGGSTEAAYVIYGGFTLKSMTVPTGYSTSGFKISGDPAKPQGLGRSVAGLGDVNGDGLDDVIVGTSVAVSYVIFGQETRDGFPVNVTTLDGSSGFKLIGAGNRVSPAGDVNGDSYDDIMISSGYVVFGKPEPFAAQVRLADLNGSDGFRFRGEAGDGAIGSRLSAAGDVNGDGLADMLFGGYGAQEEGVTVGAAYVIFGSRTPYSALLAPSELDGTNGFKIAGSAQALDFAQSLSRAGDVNGDGYDDLIIGAREQGSNLAAVVLYGRGEFPARIAASTLDGSNGFRIHCMPSFGAGQSVGGGLDVNGDGRADLLIGAPEFSAGKGAGYVLFGKGDGTPDLKVAIEDDKPFVNAGDQIIYRLRYTNEGTAPATQVVVTFQVPEGIFWPQGSVDGWKMINVDRFSYKVGSVKAGQNGEVLFYVRLESTLEPGINLYSRADIEHDGLHGRAEPYRSTYTDHTNVVVRDLFTSDITSTNGFSIGGADRAGQAGFSVSNAGDVNGDGFDDVIIGANYADAGGAAYVVFGTSKAPKTAVGVAQLNGTNGFKVQGERWLDEAGSSVRSAGDINGDGLGDLIIGAPGSNSGGADSGAAYVIFGRRSGFPAVLQLSTLDGVTGFKLQAAQAGDLFGWSVSGAGDLNRDGLADLVIGAPGADLVGPDSGAAYVIFGSRGGFGATLNVSALTSAQGFRISGHRVDEQAGIAVAGGGDLNADGFDDLVISSVWTPSSPAGGGRVYVVYGRPSYEIPPPLWSEDPANGFRMFAHSGAQAYRPSIAQVGDFNGDGITDLGIGALHGPSYVVFGRAGGSTSTLDLTTLDGSNGFKIFLDSRSFGSISDIRSAGDINGDGRADLILGGDGRGGMISGAAYVVFGNEVPFTRGLLLSELGGPLGFRIQGHSGDDAGGAAVSGAGDLNGDGFDDLIVGAPRSSEYDWFAGAAYVVYGAGLTISADGTKATFPARDGGTVTIQVSKGQLLPTDITLSMDLSHREFRLDALTLNARGQEFAGADVTISARTAAGRPAKLTVGEIRADGIDLRNVKVLGDLGQISAGDGNLQTNAIKTLSFDGLAKYQYATLLPRHSSITGGIGSFVVKGSFTGTLDVSGGVHATIGKISIGLDLDGLNGKDVSGLIRADGNIGSVKVHSIVGGKEGSGIQTNGTLGPVKIRGSVSTGTGAPPVVISALGALESGKSSASAAIASINVKKYLVDTQILAGFSTDLQPLNSGASIGNVSVGRDLARSSIAAGVQDVTNDGFGRNDARISGSGAEVSRIASILIKGTATGSEAAGDHFGITAGLIGKVRIGKSSVPITAAKDSLALDSKNLDFRLVEL